MFEIITINIWRLISNLLAGYKHSIVINSCLCFRKTFKENVKKAANIKFVWKQTIR